MTLWERILQGVTAFSVDTLVSLVAGILGARLVFYYLPPAHYGQLAFLLSFYDAGTVVVSLGLEGVFTAEIARARGNAEQGWAKFLILRYVSLLLTAATLLLVVFVGIGMWRREKLLWSIIGTYLWFAAPNRAASTLFHGATRYRRLAGQSITRSLSRLVLLATLPWWWTGERLAGVALTYPLMELLTAVASLGLARLPWDELRSASTDEYNLRSLMNLFRQKGVYATLSVPVKRIGDQLPVWFLKAMVGDAGLGAYAAAKRGYLLILSLFHSIEATLFPLVAEQAKTRSEQLRVALRQAQKYSFWLGFIVAIGGNVAAPWIVLWIAGSEYATVVPLFRLLLWHLLIYAFSQSQRPIFHAIGQQKWLFFVYLCTTAVDSILLVAGIRLLGTLGAVWAVLLSGIFIVSVRYVLIIRLAPHLWVDPRTVTRIEEFDLELWRFLTRRRR